MLRSSRAKLTALVQLPGLCCTHRVWLPMQWPHHGRLRLHHWLLHRLLGRLLLLLVTRCDCCWWEERWRRNMVPSVSAACPAAAVASCNRLCQGRKSSLPLLHLQLLQAGHQQRLLLAHLLLHAAGVEAGVAACCKTLCWLEHHQPLLLLMLLGSLLVLLPVLMLLLGLLLLLVRMLLLLRLQVVCGCLWLSPCQHRHTINTCEAAAARPAAVAAVCPGPIVGTSFARICCNR